MELHEVNAGLFRVTQVIIDRNVVLERVKYEINQPSIQIMDLPVRDRGIA
jgi:hypothetical protein